MKGFTWNKDRNGHPNIISQKFYVPDATAIERGEPVAFTQGTGIIVLADKDNLQDRILGVSLDEKEASDGTTWLNVSVSPTAVYRYHCSKVYTLTGGSTTTAVDSSLLPQTDDFWIGGMIRIVTCAADSSLVGRKVAISDSTGTTGTLTLAETLPAALAAADTIQICPGYMAMDYLAYDLDSDAMNPDFDTDGGNVMRIVGAEPDNMDIFVQFQAYESNT